MGNMNYSIAQALLFAVKLYEYVIIARALFSFFPPLQPGFLNDLYRFLIRVTEPVLYRVRRFLPATGGFDLSPLVVLLFLQYVVRFLIFKLFM